MVMSSTLFNSSDLFFFANFTPVFPENIEDLDDIKEDPDSAEVILLVCIYTVIIGVGVFGNASLLIALISQHSARVRSPLLLGLCAADLLVCGCSAPLAALRHDLSLNRPPCPSIPCVLLVSLQYFPVAASTLSLMMLSIDRYVTVQQPRLLSGLQRRPVLTIVFIWMAAALATVPVPVARIIPDDFCVINECPVGDPRSILVTVHLFLVYFIPILTVMVCHLGVRSKLCALSLTARAAHGELPLPMPLLRRPTHVIIVAGMANNAQNQSVTYKCEVESKRQSKRGDSKKVRQKPGCGPIRGQTRRNVENPKSTKPSLLTPQPQTSTLQSRRRLANVLVSVAAFFALSWIPYAACSMYIEFKDELPEYFWRFVLLVGHAHSAINPLVYWLLNHQTLGHQGWMICCRGGAAYRFLFHFKLHDDQPPSSTNEAALGPFHPRYTRARPRVERAAPSSHYLY